MVGRNPLMSLPLPLSMCKDHAAIFWFINQEKVMKHSWTLGFPHQTSPLSRPTSHHPPAGGQVFRSVVLSKLRWMTVAKRCLKLPAVMCGLNYKPTIVIKLRLLQITHVHTQLHTGTVENIMNSVIYAVINYLLIRLLIISTCTVKYQRSFEDWKTSESTSVSKVTQFLKGNFFVEGLDCSSGKSNMWVKMSTEHWWNDIDRNNWNDIDRNNWST